jgi:hypothetical protein
MCLDFEPKLDYRKRNAMNNMYYSNAAKVITYSCCSTRPTDGFRLVQAGFYQLLSGWFPVLLHKPLVSMSGPLVAAAIPEVSAFALLLILPPSPIISELFHGFRPIRPVFRQFYNSLSL